MENRLRNSLVEQYFCGRPILPYEIAQWQQARRSNYRDNRMTNLNARPWLRISAFQPVTTLFPPILPSLSQNEINFFFFFPPTFEIFLWSTTTKRAHSSCKIYQIVTRYPGILPGKSRTIASMNILIEFYNALFDWNIDLIIDR